MNGRRDRPGAQAPVWLAGEASLRPALLRALAADPSEATRIHHSPRRSVHRLELPDGTALAIKRHHRRRGLRALREAVKAALGRTSARREWRALQALTRLPLRAPEPLALLRLPTGEEAVVTGFVVARPFAAELARIPASERAQRLDALGDLVRALHAAGWRHGDLHLGNLGWQQDAPVLFDLQRARRLRSRRDALEEIARLEHDLRRVGGTPADQRRLRERLGVDDEALDAAARRFLRDHLRGRTRRRLRLDRDWAPVRLDGRRGVRVRRLPEETLRALLDAAEARAGRTAEPGRRGGRVRIARVEADGVDAVVKRVEPGGPGRALADAWRGCAAARAFRAGCRHAFAGDHAARPLAWLETRRAGLPVCSWLVLEYAEGSDLDRLVPDRPESARRLAVELAGWLAELHARGLGHRDLKGGNLRVRVEGGGFRFRLLDLEDLRGPRRIGDRARLEALAQLNASLDDAAFDPATRRAALAVYLDRLPLRRSAEAARREIVRRSLARAHRWRGIGCTGSEPESGRGREAEDDRKESLSDRPRP